MAWIRLDDGFADHPKILAAGPIAALIQIRAICWSSRHLTDGFIPREVVPSLLTGFEHYSLELGGNALVGLGNGLSEIDWADVMVKAHLWFRSRSKKLSGFYIHDFLEYNRSKTDALEMREKKASAGKVGGIKSGRLRHEANGQAPASASGSEKLNSQSPSPSHTHKTKDKDTRAAARVCVGGFDAFWTVYPRKKSKGQAEKAWAALSPSEPLQGQILAALERAMTSDDWAKDGGRYIPYPATWLRAKGWDDQHEVTGVIPAQPRGLDALRALQARDRGDDP